MLPAILLCPCHDELLGAFLPFSTGDVASWRDEEGKDSGVDMGSLMDIEERNTDTGIDN